MADLKRLEEAFMKAHKAGDTKAAGVLAAEIKRQRAQGQSTAPTMSNMDVAEDATKSFGTGVVEGVSGLLQMPEQVGDFLGHSMIYGIDRAIGYTPEEATARRAKSKEAIKKLRESTIGNPTVVAQWLEKNFATYEPKTTVGEYARTTGQFAPNALMGPGGVVRRAASVALPGVASEAVGQATEGSEYETVARVGGALAGGLASGFRASPSAAKSVLKAADTPETIPVKTKAAYDMLKTAGIKFDSYSYNTLAREADTLVKGYRTQAPLTKDAVEYLKSFGRNGIGFEDLEDVRKNVSRIIAEPSAMNADRDAARVLLEKIDDFYSSAPVITSSPGLSAGNVSSAVKNARELGRRNIILKDIEEMVRRGEYYKSGEESGLNNQFLNYLKKRSKFLTEAEREAFAAVGKGKGSLQNLVRIVGGFGIDPTRSGNLARMLPFMGAGAGYGGAYATGQDPTTGLLVGLGAAGAASGLKMAGKQMIRNNVKDAKRIVAAGKKAQTAVEKAKLKASANVKAKAALSALVATTPNRETD